MFLATAWGAKFGGINAFNMDLAVGLTAYLGQDAQVFCAVLQPTREDVQAAAARQVTLIGLDRAVDSPGYDRSWALDVWQAFKKDHPDRQIDWWIGHDVTTGKAAVEGPGVGGQGHSVLIMHMNYADYQIYKGGVGQRAHEKEREQRELFPKAHRCLANGPLLRDALKEIVDNPVMLVPGFAEVPVKPSSHRLHLITFGRMDRESDRIKQGALAVAGFGSAVKYAHKEPGSHPKLKDNPQMRVIGIEEPDGEEERALKQLADSRADRKVNLIPLAFDENRGALFKELGRANVALMLSWHEGFGLTGWEAVAGEVPLILSEQTGLWQLLKEAFGERLAQGYVRVVDVRGQEGTADTANFHPEDETKVCHAIIDCVATLDEARKNAAKLKRELQKTLVCTWENTAKQLCDALGIERSNPADAPQRASQGPAAPVSRSDFIAIPSLSWPEEFAAKGFEMPDSMLLRPESQVVKFHQFRELLLQAIIDWARTQDAPIKLRLQAGEGGAGKTRLLIEVCKRLEEQGWRAGFLDRSQAIARGLPALLKEGKAVPNCARLRGDEDRRNRRAYPGGFACGRRAGCPAGLARPRGWGLVEQPRR